MANEINVTASLGYKNPSKNISPQLLALVNKFFTITGKNFSSGTMSVPTTAGGTAIPVGGCATLGWAMFTNTDPTNFITIYTGVAGTKIARLKPGQCALLYLDPTITAPAALADTAVAQLEFLMLEI